MSAIYLFDVDGTLTPSRAKINDTFKEIFSAWAKDREIYLVSGGTFERLVNQLGIEIIEMMAGVFPCMGNAFYQVREQINDDGYSEWNKIYENKFVYPRNIKRSLNSIVAKSDFPVKTGMHYQERIGMINFSIVGRNADQSQRQQYVKWDEEQKERENIVSKLSKKYPTLDFAIGGAVSIDIFNKGNDKAQVIEKYFKDCIAHNAIHFVGDRIEFPGNDYPLAKSLSGHAHCTTHKVESWKDTIELLKQSPFT
jgi:phosphomannomutase